MHKTTNIEWPAALQRPCLVFIQVRNYLPPTTSTHYLHADNGQPFPSPFSNIPQPTKTQPTLAFMRSCINIESDHSNNLLEAFHKE
jgi:hypothetical protein